MLTGGIISEGVFRVGDTARKPTGPHTAAVEQMTCDLPPMDLDGLHKVGRLILEFHDIAAPVRRRRPP